MKLTYRQVLSRPAADGCCRLVVNVAWDGRRAKLPTGVACLPAHFRPEARQVVMRKDPGATRLNNELAKVEGAVNAAFTRAIFCGDRIEEAPGGVAGREHPHPAAHRRGPRAARATRT